MDRKQEIVEAFKKEYEKESKVHQEKFRNKKIQEEENRKAIINLCEKNDFKLEWTNGYVYKIIKGSKVATICDQKTRVTGEIHDIPRNKDEEIIIRTLNFRDNPEWEKAFNYQNVFIERPLLESIHDVFEKLK